MATPHSPAHLGPKVDQAVELGAKVGAPVGERPPPRAPLPKHARNADGAHGVEVARVMDTANGCGRPRRGAARGGTTAAARPVTTAAPVWVEKTKRWGVETLRQAACGGGGDRQCVEQ